MKKQFYLLLAMLIVVQLNGQDLTPVVQVNGKWFHEIEVKSGMTVFSISQQCQVSANEILVHNPSSKNQLSIGQKIIIPVSFKDQFHVVKAKETVFGLARNYLVSPDSLPVWNSTLTDVGLKMGQKLNIKNGAIRISLLFEGNSEENPFAVSGDTMSKMNRNFEFDDTFINYQVKAGDKLYDIAKRFFTSTETLKKINGLSNSTLNEGQRLKIPMPKSPNALIEIPQVPMAVVPKPLTNSLNPYEYTPQELRTPTKTLNIAVFLPLNLDLIVYPMKDQRSAFDFYMGASAAVDSLEALGFSGKVQFYDYLNPFEHPSYLIKSKKLDQVDFILAPWGIKDCAELSSFCLSNGKPLVCSKNFKSDSIRMNEQVYFIPSDDESQLIWMANHLNKVSDTAQIIWVKSDLKDDFAGQSKFIEYFNSIKLPDTKIIEVNIGTMSPYLNSSKKKVFLCLSKDTMLVEQLAKKVLGRQNTYLYGLKEWSDWKNFNSSINRKLDYYYFSTSCFNYNDVKVKKFHKKYRAKNHLDLSRLSCMGFDVLFSFSKWFSGYSENPVGLTIEMKFGKTEGVSHANLGLMLVHFKDFVSVKVK